MTFQSLQYFLVVYEERSITEAAKRLFISQQSLSVHIQKLEENCGAQLFIRRPVFTPTYAGDRLASAAREILRLEKEVLAEMKEIDAGQKGKLTLGCTSFLATDHLPELLSDFHKRYPHVEVNAVVGPSLKLEEQTLDGRMDFYIGSTARKKGEIVHSPLIHVGMTIIMREHILKEYLNMSAEDIGRAEREGISLEELQDTPLVIPTRIGRVREYLDGYIKSHKINMKVVLETDQALIVPACQKGIGAGILYSVTPYDDSNLEDRMYRFPLKNYDYTIHSSICYRKDHFLKSYESVFIQLTKDYFARFRTDESQIVYL